ncbi:uncharacterized protein LOC134838179 [Culicoides brevitarsis]|uniref:uncharacterized protein LOC134838179 n=1 Tax=Culicoides brevitarsis TaxID=469753 RepID=UPI00307C14AB
METPKIHSKSKHRRSASRVVNANHSPAHRSHRNPDENIEENIAANNDGDIMQNDDVNERSCNNANGGNHRNVTTDTTTTEAENEAPQQDDKLQKGILGYIDKQLKVQTLSEPPRSPAQRSTRSRSSNEKSPRRKRSKSESRRRRERKIIAAGEMEVRQANETLMRYLKQCSDFNEASLSGDLEIDENLEDRRVHRKTKAERQKKAHLHARSGKSQHSDLTTVLNELAEDVRHGGTDIYNPFTPVISPLEGPPSRIDKLYIQTSSGYRPVDNNNFYKSSLDIEADENRQIIKSGVHLSCCVQRIWILLANICHGLLAGLGLAHLLLVFTTKPIDWVSLSAAEHYADFNAIYTSTFFCLAIVCMVSVLDRMDISRMDLSGDSIQFRWVIIFMIYAATVTISLCCSSTDQRLLYFTTTTPQNSTELSETMESNNNILNVWNSLSIARSFGALIGWIIIGMSPNTDKLYAYLLEMEKYDIN